jgi:hypothetical protein
VHRHDGGLDLLNRVPLDLQQPKTLLAAFREQLEGALPLRVASAEGDHELDDLRRSLQRHLTTSAEEGPGFFCHGTLILFANWVVERMRVAGS